MFGKIEYSYRTNRFRFIGIISRKTAYYIRKYATTVGIKYSVILKYD